MKAKAAEEVGIAFKHVTLPEDAEVNDIVDIVQKLNEDDSVSGILVQLPLGPHVGADGERTVTEAISPQKDVDGCVPYLPSCFLLRRRRRIVPASVHCERHVRAACVGASTSHSSWNR